MLRCSYDECSWQAIAPSEDAAQQQLAKHVVETHTEPVDVDIPDGKVEVRFEAEGEWMTVTTEEAKQLHDEIHDD